MWSLSARETFSFYTRTGLCCHPNLIVTLFHVGRCDFAGAPGKSVARKKCQESCHPERGLVFARIAQRPTAVEGSPRPNRHHRRRREFCPCLPPPMPPNFPPKRKTRSPRAAPISTAIKTTPTQPKVIPHSK